MTEGNAAFGHVVRGDFQRNFIAGENSDVMLTHFAVCVGNQFIAVVEFDAIASVRKNFGNGCGFAKISVINYKLMRKALSVRTRSERN